MMHRMIRVATAEQLPSLYALLVLCGEHLHRTQNRSHWYPFRPFDKYLQISAPEYFYAVYQADHLVGTFNLNLQAPPYYTPERWHDPLATAAYLRVLGVLPLLQGQGIGTWIMQQVENMALAQGATYLRFDAVENNTPLLRFYDKLGYTRCGKLTFAGGWADAVCYEKAITSEPIHKD